jgi:hypothetical protein
LIASRRPSDGSCSETAPLGDNVILSANGIDF